MAGRKMTGGPTEKFDATDEVKAFCEEVRQEVEKKVGQDKVKVYKALHYRSQLVAGTNYFVKVQIDDDGKCLHLRLFEPLPCNKDANSTRNVELANVLDDKKVEDELEYF